MSDQPPVPGPGTDLPPDQHARRRAVDERTRGALVEAGAGSGKTTTLVQRVLGLLEDHEVPATSIAVITFTERAAEEVTERLLAAHAAVAATPGDHTGNGLTVTTLHGFAASLVRSFPVESGIPLQLEILDEAAAEAERVERLCARLAEPEALAELAPSLELADALGVGARQLLGDPRDRTPRTVESTWRWASEHLDRVEDAGFEPVELPDAVTAAHALLRALPPDEVVSWARSADPSDRLAAHLLTLAPALQRLARDIPPLAGHRPGTPRSDADTAASDARRDPIPDDQRLAIMALARLGRFSSPRRLGNASNWPSRALLTETRERLGEAAELHRSVLATCQHAVGQALARLTAGWADEDASLRWRAGRVSFADLLIGARRLLRSSPRARTALRQRWQRLLIDEFQDTDPIQLELACLLSSTLEPAELAKRLDAGPATGALPVPVEAGRLFVVGDPLQSIYRFRRADPELFAQAASRLAEPDGALPRLSLQANFRTVPEVLAWVDRFVERLARTLPGLAPGSSGAHADAASEAPGGPSPLRPTRRAPDSGPGSRGPSPLVGVVAEGVEATFPTARDAATAQAEALGRVAASIREHPDSWLVEARSASGAIAWRSARLGDVALLVPNRTHLAALLDALDGLDIPSRTGGGIPLGALPTFRTLCAIVHALADPFDRLATAEALRCGPWIVPVSDLGPSLDVLETLAATETTDADEAEPGPDLAGATSVEDAWRQLAKLRRAVKGLDARRALDLAARHFRLPGPEQATGELRLVWAWAERLAGEGRSIQDLSELLRESTAQEVRSPEDPLAGADDAVSVLTIHAAKGLEFPIVVLAGMDAANRSGRDAVLTDPLTRLPLARPIPGPIELDKSEARVREAVAAEHEADRAERGRLAYVACTRARDHLVLLLHRKQPPKREGYEPSIAELMAETCRDDPERWQTLDQAMAARTVLAPTARTAEVPASRPPETHSGPPTDPLAAETEPDGLPPDWPWAWLEERERATSDPAPRQRPLPFAQASHLGEEPLAPTGADEPAPTDEAVPALGRAEARRLGIAVHQVLERAADPRSDAGRALVATAAARAGVDPGLLQALVGSASASEVVERARRARRSWRELPIAAVVDGHRLEARLDLAWEVLDEDGTGTSPDGTGPASPPTPVLELADYKTTTAPLGDSGEPPHRLVERYRLQLGAYAEALERASGRSVRRAWVVRCHPDGVAEACLEGEALSRARADAARALRALVEPMTARREVRPG